MLQRKPSLPNPYEPYFYENNPLYNAQGSNTGCAEGWHQTPSGVCVRNTRQGSAIGKRPCTPAMEYFGFCTNKPTTAQNAEGSYMSADGFYNVSGGAAADSACAIAHPFNKSKREECMAMAASNKDVKNQGKTSDAALNEAIAQGITNQSSAKESDGGNTKKVLIWSGVGLVALVGTIMLIRKLRK